MKKILLLLVFAAMLFSCQKEKNEPVATQQEVSFGATIVEPNLKNSEEWECVADVTPTNAWIEIGGEDGMDFYPALFTLDNKLYTQAIKLDATDPDDPDDDYCITEFLLYKENNGTPGYQVPDGIEATPDDIIVYGVPYLLDEFGDPTYYGAYVAHPLEYCFDVLPFEKQEIDIEVLCFEEADYDDFGFFWFHITEIVIREFCFFGDVCLNGQPYEPDDFAGSWYALNGLQEDEIAFFHVKVFKNGVEVPYSPFKNYTPNGDYIAGPVCAEFPDNLSIPGEVFTFELWVLVKVGNVFTFYLFDTYTAIDDGPLTMGVPPVPATGDEGIADFAIGTCSYMSTNKYDWPSTYYVTVKSGDLATGFTDPNLAVKWFFYNDETDQIDNTLGSFVAGPGVAPAGTGSAQITVSGTQRRNLATYQFAGTPLSQITTLAFSTYNASATNNIGPNASGYLQFNVDFTGADNWQNRLIYLPWDNGAIIPDAWQEWNTCAPGALWRWSKYPGGGTWPDGVVAVSRTWNDILAAFPNIRVRISDPWMGIRVGEPYAAGYTENLDLFKFQAGGPLVLFNFDN